MKLAFEDDDEQGEASANSADRAMHSSFTESVAKVAAMLVETDGSLSLGAESLMALRSQPERLKVLQELIGSVAPPELVRGYWQQWLTEGVDPVSSLRIVKPSNIDRSTGKVFDRTDKARLALSKKVEDARKKVAAAQEVLEKAEFEASLQDANEKAALLWTVADHLVGIMAGTFAVGPAWTILRALSGYISDDDLNFAAAFSSSAAAENEAKRAAAQAKKDETQTIMLVLDQRCGDAEFEEEIRKAVLGVVMKFKDREDEATGPIYRRRGKDTIRKSVQPEGQKNAEEILDGFSSDGV